MQCFPKTRTYPEVGKVAVGIVKSDFSMTLQREAFIQLPFFSLEKKLILRVQKSLSNT